MLEFDDLVEVNDGRVTSIHHDGRQVTISSYQDRLNEKAVDSIVVDLRDADFTGTFGVTFWPHGTVFPGGEKEYHLEVKDGNLVEIKQVKGDGECAAFQMKEGKAIISFMPSFSGQVWFGVELPFPEDGNLGFL